jgi:ABC-type sugar transport system ATPase subunit
MAHVQLEEVWKYYGDIEAVRDLTLDCDDGKMLALLGPSGCGKSTTLKMIAGVEQVSRGNIFIGDRSVKDLTPGQRNIAMVFEDYALYPHLSVRENIAFPLKVRKAASRHIQTRVNDAIALLNLGDVADDNVKALSGGAQQRVSIGRALVRDPELLLFDEPLSHLDADQKVYLRGEIKRLQQTIGLTSILVTHDQIEAVAMSDKVAVMNEGMLEQVATPDELYERPANLFVANFIGEPPMNLMSAELSRKGHLLQLRGYGWSLLLNEVQSRCLEQSRGRNEITIGVRPEHLSVVSPGSILPGQSTPDGSITGRVYFRELRGDAEVLTVSIDHRTKGGVDWENPESSMVVETDGPSSITVGDELLLKLDTDRVCIFDSSNGANLLLPD